MLLTPDPAATAHNIQTHELLCRAGLAAHIVVTVTNVPLALIFYELFKMVNRRLALLDAFFILAATAIEAASLVNQFAPLDLRMRCRGGASAPHDRRLVHGVLTSTTRGGPCERTVRRTPDSRGAAPCAAPRDRPDLLVPRKCRRGTGR
jgi:hypothetical protein